MYNGLMKIRKQFRLEIWTLNRIQLLMSALGFTTETAVIEAAVNDFADRNLPRATVFQAGYRVEHRIDASGRYLAIVDPEGRIVDRHALD